MSNNVKQMSTNVKEMQKHLKQMSNNVKQMSTNVKNMSENDKENFQAYVLGRSLNCHLTKFQVRIGHFCNFV